MKFRCILQGSVLTSKHQNQLAGSDEKKVGKDLQVDTELSFGINCKALLITATAPQNGRIIKNLQPISMGV